jgi:uridylate kinase
VESNIVLKIGGSILYDSNLEVNFKLLEKVKHWYIDSKNRYGKIGIVVGGGKLSRDMHSKISHAVGGEEYLHNIAMSVTQTNAALIQGYIEDEDLFLPQTLGDAYEYLMGDVPRYIVSGGLKSGWSTDFDAAVFADILDAERILKISDIAYVYTEDPEGNSNALPIKDMSWEQYFKQFGITNGDRHKANVSMPIDTECAQFCERKELSFYIAGGSRVENMENIEQILEEGTLIHP